VRADETARSSSPPSTVRAFLAGFRLQARIVLTDPDYLMPLLTVPMFTITFLAIVRHAGRDDLTQYALLAPVLIALWALALLDAGEIVTGDRWYGVLEATIAAPTPLAPLLLGRILAVTAIALLSFVEVLLVGRLAFGAAIQVEHPVEFAATLAATAFAVSGTAVIMAGLFVLSRSPRTFQNSLSFPFYVLGGVLVPVRFLPDWLEPLSSVVFLSWAADLLRATLDAEPVTDFGRRLAMVVFLGGVGYAIGAAVVAWVLRRARVQGTIGLA
jgi:ABC-2 type transport system permease protein